MRIFINLTNNQIHDCLAINKLSNTIMVPTWISNSSSSLIDPIIVSEPSFYDSGTLTVDNSIGMF